MKNKKKKDKDKDKEFIQKARDKHGDRFDYPNLEYKSLPTKVLVECKVHGEYSAIVGIHLRTKQGGCKECEHDYKK